MQKRGIGNQMSTFARENQSFQIFHSMVHLHPQASVSLEENEYWIDAGDHLDLQFWTAYYSVCADDSGTMIVHR